MSNKNVILSEETKNTRPNYEEEVVQIIKSNLTPKILQEKISLYHENDIASAIENLKPDERRRLFSILDDQTLADIFEYLEDLGPYMEELPIKKRAAVLSCLEIPTATEYLQSISKDHRNILLELVESDTKSEIMLLSSFDEDEVGSRMTTNYVAIQAGLGVRQAMRELISQAAENDNISTIYVVDANKTLIGAIDLKDLIIAREGTNLESIIMTSYPYVYADELIEDCIERIKEYSEDSIPVLNAENKLQGVLTAPDIAQLIDEEMGDDYAMLAGLSAEEDLNEPIKKSLSKRLPWLMILLVLGLVVSSVVGLFEAVVAHLTLIVCFQSLILDMAGNVGTQSLAVTIRVLMDENIDSKQKFSLMAKEAKVGLINGFILGSLSFILIGLYLLIAKGQLYTMAFSVSACIGVALMISMLLSSICGTAIPILFKKIHIDPAVASGPFITTINDLVAVVTYYGLAWGLLIEVLHL